MVKILIISPIDKGTIATLGARYDVDCAFNATPDVVAARLADRDVVVLRSGVKVTAEAMAGAPRLGLIIRAGSGTDNIDLAYAEANGIRLARIPEPGAQAVAELTFALMLALARSVRYADEQLRRGHWAKYEIEGRLIQGKTLGIVGAGNIGRRVGQIGAALGMRPLGCVGHPSEASADELAQHGITLAPFDRVVREADFITLHVPLNATTRGLIDAETLAQVKPGAFLINLARGGVVDEAALHAALVRGDRLRGAALDVHAAEGEGQVSALAGLPNVILTPHIGATTIDTQREIGQRVVALVEAFAAERAAERLAEPAFAL